MDPFHSNREDEYFLLRWEVLRKPWNQPKGTERDELELKTLHRMIVASDQVIVATGRLQLNEPTVAQIRYMAVHEQFRGLQLGKAMMEELESLARDAGAEKVILQARENALQFYESCGYEIVMETFLLYESIQHYLMEKILVKIPE
ncbi:MAG: GNAT family N-acetyltransferase [Bacteroidetes bacterium]|nr:GNAT family N-acetyltransferase [Bacteroidota bacterium]MBL0095672.1 GNAT family N-acetyltransferase [Bacteroidota bacterium]